MDEMVVMGLYWGYLDAVAGHSCAAVVVYTYVHIATDGLALLLVADEDGAVYCTAGNR